jgi:hypothetical protein
LKKLNAFLVVVLQVLDKQSQLPVINSANAGEEGGDIANSLTYDIFEFFFVFGAVVNVNIQKEKAGPEESDDHEILLRDVGDVLDDMEVVLDEVDDFAVQV